MDYKDRRPIVPESVVPAWIGGVGRFAARRAVDAAFVLAVGSAVIAVYNAASTNDRFLR